MILMGIKLLEWQKEEKGDFTTYYRSSKIIEKPSLISSAIGKDCIFLEFTKGWKIYFYSKFRPLQKIRDELNFFYEIENFSRNDDKLLDFVDSPLLRAEKLISFL